VAAPTPTSLTLINANVAEIDETLIDWMLSLTVQQRLAALQGAIDSACELIGLAKPQAGQQRLASGAHAASSDK
jgi:hypothetical protein